MDSRCYLLARRLVVHSSIGTYKERSDSDLIVWSSVLGCDRNDIRSTTLCNAEGLSHSTFYKFRVREVCSGNIGGRPVSSKFSIESPEINTTVAGPSPPLQVVSGKAADFTNDNDYNYEHVKDGYVRSNVTLGVQWSRANNPFTCKASSEFYQFEAQYHRSGDKNMIGKVNSIQWNLIWDSIDNSAHSTANSGQHENLKNFCRGISTCESLHLARLNVESHAVESVFRDCHKEMDKTDDMLTTYCWIEVFENENTFMNRLWDVVSVNVPGKFIILKKVEKLPSLHLKTVTSAIAYSRRSI